MTTSKKRPLAGRGKQLAGAICLGALPFSVVAQEAPSAEEMWQLIQQQQREIRELKSELRQTESKIEETDVKVDATAEAVETVVETIPGQSAPQQDTHIGGYGELHYNNLDNDLPGADDKDQVDLHRFVLFLNHRFNDDVRFYSELEVEHSLAGGDEPGEVEMEQAFIEWDVAAQHRAKAGLFLLPVGILNETHEPDTFYGVERNNVESKIIPSTWWEAGAGLSGELAPGLNYDLALHSGLDMGGELEGGVLEDAGIVRDGRQKAAKAKANDFAGTGRITYSAVPGLQLGLSVQLQQDVLQGETVMGAENIGGRLLEGHASYQSGPFALRALYARWDFDEEIDLLRSGADEQEGWYLEPAFRVSPALGLFARYSVWDTQAGDSVDSEYTQTDLGVNYWLAESVVLKADYQVQDAPDGESEFDGFNLGVGWSF